jgi:hypothetical protein
MAQSDITAEDIQEEVQRLREADGFDELLEDAPDDEYNPRERPEDRDDT